MTQLKKRKSKAAKFRLLQFISGFHRIHHYYWSYGWKFPFIRVGYFPADSFGQKHGFKKLKGRRNEYHDCTETGIY
ncbi:hypothetical protein A3849_27795 [Paenibacillus sp. P46E]|nr:hypothetical protein A3849_27795 [Paenibacillus sp. P46E]